MPSLVPSALPHVLRSCIYLSVPFLAVYFFSCFVHISTWTFVILQTICLPLYLTARVQIQALKTQRGAACAGAIFAPPLVGKSFGSADLLAEVMKSYKEGYLCDRFNEAHTKLGPVFDLHVLWDTITFTIDANIIKTILATDFNNYVKGEVYQAFMHSVLGSGVFNADARFHRSMTRPFFSRDRISHFDIFDKHSDAALNKMKERLAEGHAVDFQDLISRFTLDSASEFLFGKCVNVLESPLPYPPRSPEAARQVGVLSLADRFARAFARAQDTIASRGRLGYIWPWLEIFKDKTKDDMKIVDAFLNPILKDALEKRRNEVEAGLWQDVDGEEVADEDTFLDHLVRTTTNSQIIHDEILNILIAGRDTTASTLTFAVYFLCMYPHVLRRLRKEILETVGPSRRPDYNEIKDMKYLRAFLNEVLRLYPAVYAVNDTTIPNPEPNGKPFFIPAGQGITYSVFLMHRRKDYWGEDAEEFDPDRFLDERIQYILKNPFIFLPFNAGPRICLGQQFAYNQMSFFLIKLLQNFSEMSLRLDCQDPKTLPPKEWASCPGRKGIEKMVVKSHLTAYTNGGLWVKMTEA
ncbi:cytochrom P450 [Cristinia sonorae]|uniref:Cytochrom P450 n=1 Tax=Cristinia sonorae TaxID=1940300 RepID=A0A8K0URN3_9AGAR|nr:cytochrom P450 [Cristinia sonorae]